MRNVSFLLSIPPIVAVSAAIAYGLVFWTPLFGPRVDYYGGGYSYDYSYIEAEVVELSKLQPEQFQNTVQTIFEDVLKLTDAQLYMLNSVESVCLSTLIECYGVPSQHVKPFVEKALAYKQSRDIKEIAADSANTARWSLAVAFAALLISIGGFIVNYLTFQRKLEARRQ